MSAGKNHPITRRIIRLFRRVAVWVSLMILLTYGASNLWLSSRWATGMVESRLKEKTGLDWQIGGISWSPWAGVTINDVKMNQPDVLQGHLDQPVIEVQRIQVKPYWGELLRGRIRMREISIDTPRVTVAVEMLGTLAMDAVRGQPMPPVVSPIEKPQPAIEGTRVAGAPQGGVPNEGESEEEKPQPSEKKRVKPGTAPPTKPSQAKQPDQVAQANLPPVPLPLHITIKSGALKVVSVNQGADLIELEGLEVQLPLLGEDAEGVVKVALVKMLGGGKMRNLKQPISWKRPYLEWVSSDVSLGDLNAGYRVQLGISDKWRNLESMPFLMNIELKPQKLERVMWLERAAMEVEGDQVVAEFRCAGLLLQPMTWSADMRCLGKNVRVKEEHGGRDILFDEIVIPAVFRQGTLRWGGVRMIGEDLSVLGNGRVSVRGGVLSITRLVASPEVSGMLNRGVHGAGLLRNGPRWWQDLDTPDRQVRDLLVSGSLMEPMVDAGYNHEEIPVWPMVQSTLQFIREEMKEEGVWK